MPTTYVTDGKRILRGCVANSREPFISRQQTQFPQTPVEIFHGSPHLESSGKKMFSFFMKLYHMGLVAT